MMFGSTFGICQMYVHTVQAMIAKLKLKCAHKKVDIFNRTLEEFFFGKISIIEYGTHCKIE